MKKALIIGGVAVAVLGIGYYVLRKREQPALGDDFLSYSARYVRYASYATSQIAQALAGSKLASYRDAANASEMINTSATNAEAQIKAAYWLAVASRVLGSRALAVAASSCATLAQRDFLLPGSSLYDGNIEQIMSDAASKLPKNSTNASIKAIRVILIRQTETAVVDNKRAARSGPAEIAYEAGKKTVDDINPFSPSKAWWTPWAWGLGLSVAALLALRFGFSREYHALGGLIASKKEAPKQIEQKEVA